MEMNKNNHHKARIPYSIKIFFKNEGDLNKPKEN